MISRQIAISLLIAGVALCPIQSLANAATPPPLPQDLPPEFAQQFANDLQDEVIVLTPEMIRYLRDMVDQSERAESDRYDYAEPRISTEVISNRPGEQIRQLYVGTNFNSNIIFKDEAGAPWPVVYYNVGNSSAYKINEINDHTFEIEVLQPNVYSNLTFMLQGHDGPIMIDVAPPEHFIDYTKSYTVQGVSPATTSEHRAATARAQRAQDRPQSNEGLSQFLDGIPPQEALSVAVIRGADQDMWIWDGRLIIRTQMRLMSPASEAEPLYGSNGWRVYSVRNPSSILTFIHRNNTQMTFISESAIKGIRNEGS